MSDQDTIGNFRKAKEAWEKARAKYAKKIKPHPNISGIPIKTVYTQEDIEGLDLNTMPGVYPFTRGLYADGYALTPWMQQMVFGYGCVDDTRKKMESLVEQGMEGYFGHKVFNVVYDIPTMYGIDADHPEAEGNVGQCGVHLCTPDDYDELIRDWELETTNFSLITGDNCLPGLAQIVAAAERRGKSMDSLRGNSMNWYPRIAVQDIPSWEPKHGYALMADLIKYCTRNMPAWNTTNIFMYGISEAGATPVQELAYGLAWGKSVIDAGKGIGIDPDRFVGRLGFQIGIQMNFFEEIAKLRAHRKMWAKITKDAGCTKPRCFHARVHIHTSGNVLVAQQPLNNTARITMQIMAAVLGGVQSIHSCSYDETIGIPTELSHRTALRSQQIMMWESGMRDVTDPLAGSYFVEWLTDQIEKEAWKVFNEVEERGGYMKGLEDGWIKREIDNSAYDRKAKITSGKLPVVGVNKYVSDEKEEHQPFRIDYAIERKAIERLRAFKKKRSQQDVDKALADLKNACVELKENRGELMPHLIEGARKGITNGEMMDVMRDAFGWIVTE
ncbi:MAG: acyl-CoA mutase large subunit family protein [Deltaproteobacteria bacterium]|nr:acyl-CoA mutase large subunit family protein [Deltaproteobacteria bacterium]